LYRSGNSKGQIAFEFIMILAIMLIITALLANDFFRTGADTMVLSAVKQSSDMLLNQKALSTPSCSGAYVESIFYDNVSAVKVYMKNCVVDASLIAYAVEKNECRNKNLVYDPADFGISCGLKTYDLEAILV
jgi:hypothetical protein